MTSGIARYIIADGPQRADYVPARNTGIEHVVASPSSTHRGSQGTGQDLATATKVYPTPPRAGVEATDALLRRSL